MHRRHFAAASGIALLGTKSLSASLPSNKITTVKVELPRLRVPLSFVIDDSTCLVNMGHFCTPQFAQAWPSRKEYKKPWQEWPREIPDGFVREFGEWCSEHGVKGKYSIVPNPACVGWLDRELPGWSRKQLNDSLKLVRELMLPNWDIHPEMITHTRVIDLNTGRPIEEINASTMENSFPQVKKSVDELAEYLAYALRILKNCGLPCQGITTPGGFGNAVKRELAAAVQQAVPDVFPEVDLPHYFKYVHTGQQSTFPMLESVRDRDSTLPQLVANVPAGTGDWFGGWQGDKISEPDRYLSRDGQSGRMAELVGQRQPAVMLCHWPGMYCQGTKSGFRAFQRIVRSLRENHGDSTIWMRLSEIGRYQAAKELTKIKPADDGLDMEAPFATTNFTLKIEGGTQVSGLIHETSETKTTLQRVDHLRDLVPGTYHTEKQTVHCCFDLPRGNSAIRLVAPN